MNPVIDGGTDLGGRLAWVHVAHGERSQVRFYAEGEYAGTATALPTVDTEVIGVDYRVNLAEAIERVGGDQPVQGNLDPALLFAPWEPLASRVRAILTEGAAAPGEAPAGGPRKVERRFTHLVPMHDGEGGRQLQSPLVQSRLDRAVVRDRPGRG